PRNETVAWTIHFEEPLVNLFVTGNNPSGMVMGNLFQEDVKNSGKNLFYSDLIQGTETPRSSVVDFEGADVFKAVEAFCHQSEQRPARLFRFSEEDFIMVSAQPDCDMEWFESLNDEKIRTLDQTETLSLLETRHYRWECGCNQQRIMEILAPTMRLDPESLFDGEEMIRVGCPRCGAKHKISREALEAYVTTHEKSKE
ncbi:MAG: Hsp33 family molecular chaperone HslO, partial [Chthoniobacterales bacterium]